MSLREQFQEWYEKKHAYAKNWKEKSGKAVVGNLCTYVPEEILTAAGMLSVRILGSHEPQDVTEPHIFGMFCPFSRDALAQGLKGKYSYVDAIVLSHSCLHFRQTFSSWQMHVPLKWSYYLPMPNQVQSPRARTAHQCEVEKFRHKVELETGGELTLDALESAIGSHDRNRSLLREIYALRKMDNPPVTGTDAVYLAVTSQFIHKEDHNKALEAFLRGAAGYKPDRNPGVRLMTIGSENDDPKFFEMVESLEATIVADEQCAGSRYFWNTSIDAGDPLKTIANRYLDRPPCPTKDYPERRRFAHIMNLAKEYRAQGAILMQEKFCDPHEADNPALRKFLEESGIPTLTLEFDSTNPLGPLRVRVEAFLETLKAEELF